MNWELIKDVIDYVQKFQEDLGNSKDYSNDIQGFKYWISDKVGNDILEKEPYWDGKEIGRSAESAINTFILHLNRYAKTYSKSAIHGSDFSTQEEFIYLINLKAFGEMSKIELIKKNIHDKPTGIQIINRLIDHGWVEQNDSIHDRRSKTLKITEKGIQMLDRHMNKIRQASKVVCGDLTQSEKMQLIRLLTKLEDFHQPIYRENIEPADLLDHAMMQF